MHDAKLNMSSRKLSEERYTMSQLGLEPGPFIVPHPPPPHRVTEDVAQLNYTYLSVEVQLDYLS